MKPFPFRLSAIIVMSLSVMASSNSFGQTANDAAFVETVGAGVVVRDFDQFSIQVQARANSDTRAAALAKASARADELRAVLGRIAGVSGFKIVSTRPSVAGIGPGCENFSASGCRPTSYFANIAVGISATPATAAGAAVVVLEEQGFVVDAPRYGLSNQSDAARLSKARAFQNARASADNAASTAGCRRGKLLNIIIREDPSAQDGETVIVTGTRREGDGGSALTPGFNLQLEAGKANIVADVRTKFQLVCPG
jgi:uncharacterized protein YggE